MDALLAKANSKMDTNEVFFKPLLYFNPASSRKLEKTFFDSETSQLITSALQSPALVQLYGFQFCPMLDKSRFRLNQHIYPLGGSLGQVNPTPRQIIRLLDKEAERIFDDVMDRMETACEEVILLLFPQENLQDKY
jgi:hypothetical protein